MPHITRSSLTEMMSGLTLGGSSLEEAGIAMPNHLNSNERQQLIKSLAEELKMQVQSPPVLPRSQIPDLPPKPHVGDFLDPNVAATEEAQRASVSFNNQLATISQRVDRQRNNQAAKKSRETRVEALNNAKSMLNQKAAEINWLRLKVITLGGQPDEWHSIPQGIKDVAVAEIKELVHKEEAKEAERKKRAEAKKRIDRNKMKAVARIRRATIENLGDVPQFPLPQGFREFVQSQLAIVYDRRNGGVGEAMQTNLETDRSGAPDGTFNSQQQ